MLLFLATPFLKAQQIRSDWAAGVYGGAMIFYGDVKNFDYAPLLKNKNELRAGGSISVYKEMNPYLYLSGMLLQGKLAGAHRQKNLFFEAEFREYTMSLIINFNDLIFYYNESERAMVYALLGTGLSDFRTIKYTLDSEEILDVEGYMPNGKDKLEMTTEVVTIAGFGLTYYLGRINGSRSRLIDRIDITAEFRWSWINTDNLDLDSSIRPGKDKYSYLAFGIRYNFE